MNILFLLIYLLLDLSALFTLLASFCEAIPLKRHRNNVESIDVERDLLKEVLFDKKFTTQSSGFSNNSLGNIYKKSKKFLRLKDISKHRGDDLYKQILAVEKTESLEVRTKNSAEWARDQEMSSSLYSKELSNLGTYDVCMEQEVENENSEFKTDEIDDFLSYLEVNDSGHINRSEDVDNLSIERTSDPQPLQITAPPNINIFIINGVLPKNSNKKPSAAFRQLEPYLQIPYLNTVDKGMIVESNRPRTINPAVTTAKYGEIHFVPNRNSTTVNFHSSTAQYKMKYNCNQFSWIDSKSEPTSSNYHFWRREKFFIPTTKSWKKVPSLSRGDELFTRISKTQTEQEDNLKLNIPPEVLEKILYFMPCVFCLCLGCYCALWILFCLERTVVRPGRCCN